MTSHDFGIRSHTRKFQLKLKENRSNAFYIFNAYENRGVREMAFFSHASCVHALQNEQVPLRLEQIEQGRIVFQWRKNETGGSQQEADNDVAVFNRWPGVQRQVRELENQQERRRERNR